MVRIGIVGCNYGRSVLLPAFRADPRVRVTALAGTDALRVEAMAKESGLPFGFGDWRSLVEHLEVDAVAIATPPRLQAQIAGHALSLGKPVFLEKPLAGDLAGAAELVKCAARARQPAMIDFQFPEISAWQRAKELLDSGAIGRMRHIVLTWNVENAATRLRLNSWKTSRRSGGGVLGNFVSHCFYYLEWFAGPLAGFTGRLTGLVEAGPDDETTAALALSFMSGAGGSLFVSSASYLGSGHRLEFYGDDGALILVNGTLDTMRGFELWFARRPATALVRMPIEDPSGQPYSDGRIVPVSRLAKRFVDAIEHGGKAEPGFAAGYRVQQLIESARRSHDTGCWIDTAPEMIG